MSFEGATPRCYRFFVSEDAVEYIGYTCGLIRRVSPMYYGDFIPELLPKILGELKREFPYVFVHCVDDVGVSPHYDSEVGFWPPVKKRPAWKRFLWRRVRQVQRLLSKDW